MGKILRGTVCGDLKTEYVLHLNLGGGVQKIGTFVYSGRQPELLYDDNGTWVKASEYNKGDITDFDEDYVYTYCEGDKYYYAEYRINPLGFFRALANQDMFPGDFRFAVHIPGEPFGYYDTTLILKIHISWELAISKLVSVDKPEQIEQYKNFVISATLENNGNYKSGVLNIELWKNPESSSNRNKIASAQTSELEVGEQEEVSFDGLSYDGCNLSKQYGFLHWSEHENKPGPYKW